MRDSTVSVHRQWRAEGSVAAEFRKIEASEQEDVAPDCGPTLRSALESF